MRRDELWAPGFLNDVVLNQVLVSFGSPDDTQRVIDAIQARWHVLVRRDGLAGARS